MASEYLKWKYRDVKPDEPIQLTAKQKRQNWWHYHKWHVVIGVVLLVAAGNILYHALGIGKVRPDYQIAYVGANPLPNGTIRALEEAIAALGEDCNGDGKVVVRLNQYAYTGADLTGDSDGAMYAYASNTALMADLTDCDSYFFLLEDPDKFQQNYQVLRRLDGSLPSDLDRDYEGCFLSWTDCPVLTGLALGEYTENILSQENSGDNQTLLENLYLARRGFWTDKTVQNAEGCDALWDILTKEALS